MANVVIARDQWFINSDGNQYVRGYDETSVVGRGRTLAAAARRSRGWYAQAGYRAYEEKTGRCLGKVYEYEDGKFTVGEE